ncbi:phage holin family protein [Rugosimonospora acidiphila]
MGVDGSQSQSSVGELLTELSRDVSRLVRQEVELAKAELRQEVKKTGKVGGLFGGSALAGYMTLLFLSIAAWWGLANVMDQGWAALIVAGVWAVIGVFLFAAGRAQGRRITGLRQTTATVREVPGALKPGPDHKGER